MTTKIIIKDGEWEIVKTDNEEYMISDTRSHITVHTKGFKFSSDKKKDIYLNFFSDGVYTGCLWIDNEGDRLAIEALIKQTISKPLTYQDLGI